MSKEDYSLSWGDFVDETESGSFIKITHVNSLYTNIDLIKDNLANVTHDSGVLTSKYETHNNGDRAGHNDVLKSTNFNDRDVTEYSDHKINHYTGHLTSKNATECSANHNIRYIQDDVSKENTALNSYNNLDDTLNYSARFEQETIYGCTSYHSSHYDSQEFTVFNSENKSFLETYDYET
jgi:hypothetical protein